LPLTGAGVLRLQFLPVESRKQKCNRRDSSPVNSYRSARSA
jgi:hypothetical protein